MSAPTTDDPELGDLRAGYDGQFAKMNELADLRAERDRLAARVQELEISAQRAEGRLRDATRIIEACARGDRGCMEWAKAFPNYTGALAGSGSAGSGEAQHELKVVNAHATLAEAMKEMLAGGRDD